jgi:hypothetical protein
MLSVNDNDVIEAAATGKELDGNPEDFLSAAAFLNDDGTLVDSSSADATVAREVVAAAPAAGVDASRRLKTWGRHNDKNDKNDDKDDDDECPRGWLNSKRNCDVTGCGTCCVRISK